MILTKINKNLTRTLTQIVFTVNKLRSIDHGFEFFFVYSSMKKSIVHSLTRMQTFVINSNAHIHKKNERERKKLQAQISFLSRIFFHEQTEVIQHMYIYISSSEVKMWEWAMNKLATTSVQYEIQEEKHNSHVINNWNSFFFCVAIKIYSINTPLWHRHNKSMNIGLIIHVL